MVKVGDVVSYRNAKWIVHKHEGAALRLLRKQRRRILSMHVGIGGVTVEGHPTFQPGEKVICSDGREGVVERDPGDDGPVCVSQATRFALAGGGFITTQSGGRSLVDRASLILDNGGGSR